LTRVAIYFGTFNFVVVGKLTWRHIFDIELIYGDLVATYDKHWLYS